MAKNKSYFDNFVRQRPNLPKWYSALDHRVFTRYHPDPSNANESAIQFVQFLNGYKFELTEPAYRMLEEGTVAIWGYDRRLRPVIHIDLFSITEREIPVVIEALQLVMTLAYSKMLCPGLVDAMLIVVDTANRHFINCINVRFLDLNFSYSTLLWVHLESGRRE